MRKTRFVIGCAALITALAAPAQASGPHDTHDMIHQTWTTEVTIQVIFESGFGASARRSVEEGFEAWDDILGTDVNLTGYTTTSTPLTPYTCVGIGLNHIYVAWADLGGDPQPGVPGWQGTLGVADLGDNCANASNKLYRGAIAFNSRLDDVSGGLWHKVYNTQPDQFDSDLRSTATHEAGHALGFDGEFGYGDNNHWPAGASICGIDNGYHTMCPATPTGTVWGRTPEHNDIDEFLENY